MIEARLRALISTRNPAAPPHTPAPDTLETRTEEVLPGTRRAIVMVDSVALAREERDRARARDADQRRVE